MESTNKVNYERKKTASVSKTSKANETTTKELQLIKIELATNQSMQSEQGSQAIVMPHEHSMFLQCIPATREQLGPDILAKVWSIVCNTLFWSAKLYPLPCHTDKVVGLCLYNCNFHLAGMKGDFLRTKYWDVVHAEIIMQTGILYQQVIPQWHCIARGMSFVSVCLLHLLLLHSSN